MPTSDKIWSCFSSTFCCPLADQLGTDDKQQVLENNTKCATSLAEDPRVDDILSYRLDLPSRDPSTKWNLSYEKPVQDIEEELNWSLKRNKELTSRIHELEDFMCAKVKDSGSQSTFCDKLKQELEQSLKEKRQAEGRVQKAEQSIRDLKHEMAILQKRLQQAENPSPGSLSSGTPPLLSPLPPAAGSIRSHVLVTQRPLSLWNTLQISRGYGEEDSLTTVSGGSYHLKQHAMTEILQMIRHGVPLKPVTPCKKATLSPCDTHPVSSPDMRECIQERGQQEAQEGAKSLQPDVSLEVSRSCSPDQGQMQGDAGPEECRDQEHFLDYKNLSLRKVGKSESSTDNTQSSTTVTCDSEDKKACSVSFHNSELPQPWRKSIDRGQLPCSMADIQGPSNKNCIEGLVKTTSDQEIDVLEPCATSSTVSMDLLVY